MMPRRLVLWLARDDVFTFHFKPVDDDFVYTKWNVLKKVASLFDPFGFLSPYTIRAKILLQMMWSCGLDWDEQLDSLLLNEARNFFADLIELSSVRIPRCLRVPDELSVMSVHVFADASAAAYAAVAYTRCEYVLGQISCHFVCAKTKVAPLTSTSIRRLELMVAVLAVQMSVSVVKVLEIPVTEVHFWTDSMNVLFWTQN